MKTQSKLNRSPASGVYDLRFSIYDTAASPSRNVIAGPLAFSAVPVSNWLFTVLPDLSQGVFNGEPRWLHGTYGGAGVFSTFLV